MKLAEHVEKIRNLISRAYGKQFSSLGIGESRLMNLEITPEDLHPQRLRLEEMLNSHIEETGSYQKGRAKLIDELTFTFFNRIAAVKVMEAAKLFPPIITRETKHGGRSFGHKAWLELHRDMRYAELEGLRDYIQYAFNDLGDTLPLYSKTYPYNLLPDSISINEIIDTFNLVEKDPDVEDNLWGSDDVLGWLYESYNNAKKKAFKDSGAKTEYDKVYLQSQVYTPHWVVKFLADNSLGKLYLEMYPDSKIKEKYKIANNPETQERDPKPLTEVKIIDPACGSGNFLLYAFNLLYDLYIDQIENYGANYREEDLPQLIIENNLHGIDLDNRAAQLAQLGLYIKACKAKRDIGHMKCQVVSSDFYLPDYDQVRHIFENGSELDQQQKTLIAEVWVDLQNAFKFGSLIRVDEKIKAKLNQLINKRIKINTQENFFSDEEIGIKPQPIQQDLFLEHDIAKQERFSDTFFRNLNEAVARYAKSKGNSFLASQAKDALVFLELLTIEYDIAMANPPYTDSGDFGIELQTFIDDNYKKPHKFNTNLYAAFIKRCLELTKTDGYVSMIHPLTFMYIKSFENVRKFIIKNTNLILLAELGLGGVFPTVNVQVDVCMYIFRKGKNKYRSLFFNLKKYKNYSNKPEIFSVIYNNLIQNRFDQHIYQIDQSKLKVIDGWPFIYWISDEFRGIFELAPLKNTAEIISGVKTGNNFGALRFWWELDDKNIYNDKKPLKWIRYTKGGPYRKWYGNNWLCVNYNNDAQYIRKQNSYNLISEKYMKKVGITYSGSGSKGVSFRLKDSNILFDMGSSAIFFESDPYFLLALLNSKLIFYIANCLNPTVNKQPNDIKRIPFLDAQKNSSEEISFLSKRNVDIFRFLEKYSLIEFAYSTSPFQFGLSDNMSECIIDYLNYENNLTVQILLNEAVINNLVYDIYQLTENDKMMIQDEQGQNVGDFPVDNKAKEEFLSINENIQSFSLKTIIDFIHRLPTKVYSPSEIKEISSKFGLLYKNNNSLEEFCQTYQINPINVWYWFKEKGQIPKNRKHILAMEFLTDQIREILNEKQDGIVQLVSNTGKLSLLHLVEEKFSHKKFSPAQFAQFELMLENPIDEYISYHYFEELTNHLKLFKRLPATPFIWHLSSGPEKGFECFISIYKWNRDKLLRLRSVYVEQRESVLKNRQSDLTGSTSAEVQNERDKIYKQLKEIDDFKKKIDELLAEGYDPVLDDGVGKNIAPLQAKGMLAYDVLTDSQLEKYLNADW